MVTRYNGMDPEQPDKISDEFNENNESELSGDESGQASRFRHDPSERRFRLFHLLSANDLTRQDIFERLGDYYQINESGAQAVGLSSQRAGKMLLRDLQFLERVGYQVEKRGKGARSRLRLKITILPQMIDGTRQRKPIEFRFWLDANLAKSSLSQRWLFQTVERDDVIYENGRPVHRLLIRAQAYSDFRIIQQLLKYGSKVELIDPPDLREQMRREVERLHNLYTSQ